MSMTSEVRGTSNNGTPLRQVSKDNLGESFPQWYNQLRPTWGEKIVVPEWEEEGNSYRAKNGWKGRDLIHDPSAAIYIPEYFVKYGTETDGLQRGGKGTTLTGLVYFSERAESHPGYCHGGSMCSVMDDVIGWVGFMVTGECIPWSGL